MFIFDHTVITELRENFTFLIAGQTIKGLSKKRLSELSNINQLTLARIESGDRMPTLPTLCALADILGVRNMNTFFKKKEAGAEEIVEEGFVKAEEDEEVEEVVD